MSKHEAGSYQFDDGSTLQVSAEDAACLNKMLAKSSMAKEFKKDLMKSKANFNAALKMAKTLKESDMRETSTDKAMSMWNEMTPAQRLDIMQKVPDDKSITKKHRSCIDYIRKNMIKESHVADTTYRDLLAELSQGTLSSYIHKAGHQANRNQGTRQQRKREDGRALAQRKWMRKDPEWAAYAKKTGK